MIFFESGWDDIMYEIIDISKKDALFSKKKSIEKVSNDSFLKVFVAYPHKIWSIELIVQKLTELWIWEIIFFAADYSQIKSIPDNKQKRLALISLEATEQSWRNKLVNIVHHTKSMTDILKQNEGITMIFGSPHDENFSLSEITNKSMVWFWVWPEWGWSEKEIHFFQTEKYHLWKFNQNILRLETAAIVGSGILVNHLSLID